MNQYCAKIKNVFISNKPIMWNSFKITLILFAILFLVFALFFKDSFLAIGHMTLIRVLRGAIFTWFSLVFLQSVLDISFLRQHGQRKKWLTSLAWSALWITLYTIVFARTENGLKHDIGNYYIVPCLLFSLSLLLNCIISRLPRWCRIIYTIFYSLFLFSILLTAIFFLIYDFIYGQPFDEYALLSVIATNPDEIMDYLSATFSSLEVIAILLILIALFLSITISNWKSTVSPYTPHILRKRFSVILLIISYFFINYIITVFPIDQVLHLHRQNGSMNVFIQLENNIQKNESQLQLKNNAATLAKTIPGTVVLVIGESANRDRMSAFSYTERNTTPWEKEMSHNKNFTFFPKAYANFPNTVMAVTQALTNANQYNQIPLSNAVDLLEVAKRAGYHTYWFSMQNKSTVSDAGITILANQAETLNWLKGYDENILDKLRDIPENQNNFIILHIQGSHFNYDRRVPEWFLTQNHLENGSKETNYDNSLLYTDYILQQIFEYLDQHNQLQAMIYVSDHGENMQYTHTASPFVFDMVHIPMWIYLSPQYEAHYPSTIEALRNNNQKVFTNDLVFELISGILQAPSNVYDEKYDISSPRYSLTDNQALTLQGKRHVSEDL